MTQMSSAVLSKWMGEYGEDAMSYLMGATGLSFYTLDKMVRGKYPSMPTKPTRIAILTATGLAQELLFPTVGKKEAS